MKSDRPVRATLPRTALRYKDAHRGTGIFDRAGVDNIYIMQDLFDESVLPGGNHYSYIDTIHDDQDLLVWALDLIAHSPLAFALIRKAAEKGWNMGVSDLGTGGFHLDVPEKQLIIDHCGLTPDSLVRSPFFRNSLILTLVRGLRDIWQEERFGALERDYRPEAVLLLERVRSADSDTIAVMVAWELRGAGMGEIWRYLLGSEEGDMALTFSNILERDPSAFMNGSALPQVFRQWFADDARVAATDHQTLETLDLVLDWAHEEQGGSNPFGTKAIDGLVIERFSCLPGGRAYLHTYGHALSTDPLFSSMNDPINQSHLFQVVYDMDAFIVDHVPFRDRSLARKIFPHTHQ